MDIPALAESGSTPPAPGAGAARRAQAPENVPAEPRRSGDLLRNHGLRNGTRESREFRLAALNLMEDALLARRAEERQGAERERAEERVRESEEWLRLSLRSGNVFTWEVDPETRKVRYSPNAGEVLGFAAPARVEENFALVAPEDRGKVTEAVAVALRTGEKFELEHRLVHPESGVIVWIRAEGKLVKPPDGPARFSGVTQNITARKQAEEAVRESEQRLRTLADAVPQIIWTNAGDGTANYFNRRWYEFSGLDFERSAGPGWQAIVHPKDAPACIAAWQNALGAGEVFDCEFRLRSAEGAWRWFIGRNVPMRDPGGRVSAWFGTATDIHDLKMADEALRAGEERYRIALEAAEMAAWDYETATDLVVWNDQHYRLLGREPDGQPKHAGDFLQAVHSDDQAAVTEQLRIGVEETGIFRADFRIVRADTGAVRWMSGFGRAMDRTEGKVTRMSGVMFDTTEQHEAEERLLAAQERLRILVESALEHAIISLDLERRITSWNGGAERILGYTVEEALGQSGDVIFTPEDIAAGVPAKEQTQALAGGRAGDNRWMQRRDGSRFWANGAMLPMRARPGGAVIGFVKILRDETGTQQAKEELERSRTELWEALQETERARGEAEAAGQAKDHFLAVLSHELRTPLTPVMMAVHTLARRKDLPEPVREALGMIRRNIQLEARFVDDLLDVTRIARGKMELLRVPMDLHEAIARGVEVSRPDIHAKKQRLHLALDATEHRVEGDLSRLQQVVWNLLKNASKFTPRGGDIRLRTRHEDGRVLVEIADTGIGIAPEALPRIFEPFTQADVSITREFGGLGLGLAIAKATVLGHGGELRVASEGPGQGATFTVSLPVLS